MFIVELYKEEFELYCVSIFRQIVPNNLMNISDVYNLYITGGIFSRLYHWKVNTGTPVNFNSDILKHDAISFRDEMLKSKNKNSPDYNMPDVDIIASFKGTIYPEGDEVDYYLSSIIDKYINPLKPNLKTHESTNALTVFIDGVRFQFLKPNSRFFVADDPPFISLKQYLNNFDYYHTLGLFNINGSGGRGTRGTTISNITFKCIKHKILYPTQSNMHILKTGYSQKRLMKFYKEGWKLHDHYKQYKDLIGSDERTVSATS